MKSKKTSTNQAFSKLRADAENLLYNGNVKESTYEGKDIKTLFQELQVHQIELEMQNDELRIANEELEIQQLKFSGIYDLAPIGYFIMNRYGLITEVNAAGVRLFNAGKLGLMNKHLQGFVSPDHSSAYYNFYKKLIASSERQSCQVKFIANNNREFYAQIEGIAINSSYNANMQCYVAVIDITERIEAEQSLLETKDRLELSLQASQAGTWELDMVTMQFYLDKANLRLCNAGPKNFDGGYNSFINLIHPDDRLAADGHFRTAINTDKEVDILCRFVSAEKKVNYISIRGHLVTKPNQSKSFIGIMLDFTEKKRIEEEATQLKIDHQKSITTATLYAEESERTRISESLHDSVSQLLYGIKIQLNQFNTHHPPSVQAVTKVNELLNIAIKETRNISFELAPSILKDFGLPSTIDELAKRLTLPGLIIKANVKGFTKRLDLLLETCVFRIIQELVNNCMKHSGGNLIIIELKQNKNIEIVVKDNGKGFNVKENDSKRPRGAGLQSIHNRLSLYNGDLQISSTLGKGTIVRISLTI